jgi:hypothetical protein
MLKARQMNQQGRRQGGLTGSDSIQRWMRGPRGRPLRGEKIRSHTRGDGFLSTGIRPAEIIL